MDKKLFLDLFAKPFLRRVRLTMYLLISVSVLAICSIPFVAYFLGISLKVSLLIGGIDLIIGSFLLWKFSKKYSKIYLRALYYTDSHFVVMTRAEFARFIDQSCDFNGKTANAQIKEFYEEHKDKMASIECREMFHFEDWKSFLSRKTLDSLDEKTKDACELNFGTESFNHQSNIYGMLIFDDENAAVHLKLIF